VAIAARDAIQRGDIPGSRVVPCGQIICMTGGHGSEPPALPGMAREADGPDDCRRAVREQVRAGAECIKVTTNGPLNVVELTPAELEAIVDEAHRCERRVACHASILASSQMAIRAGVDTMEHGCDLDEPAARAMADRGIVLVPTLLVMTLIMDRWDEYKTIPMMKSIPVRAKRHVESFQLAMAAGVTTSAAPSTRSSRHTSPVTGSVRCSTRRSTSSSPTRRSCSRIWCTSSRPAVLELGRRRWMAVAPAYRPFGAHA
jgi:imidazolonepropionase-like amidohydrolase